MNDNFRKLDAKAKEHEDTIGSLSKSASEYEWTSNAGQLTYVMPAGQTYDTTSKWFWLTVGGAPVPLSQIQMDSPSQFTLLVDSSKIPDGVKVWASWVEPFVPATAGHHTKHELGGADELDITKLKNFQEKVATPLANKVTSTNVKEIRDNANVFEYSLDGTTWKQVQGGGSSSMNEVLINDYGADATGVADSFAAFNTALAKGKPVSALPGTYKVSGTLVIPRKGTLILNAGVTIKPSGNFNVIQIKPNCNIYGNGATIDVSGVSGFSMAGLYASGQDRFSVAGELTTVDGLNINGKDHEGDSGTILSTNYTGKGIHFYSGNNWAGGYQGQAYVAYVQVSNINISNFYRGIWLEREQTPVQGNPWITSCTFDQINMYAAMRSIDITTNDSFYNGGHSFSNLQLQANSYSERYIYSDGSNNVFQGEFWDLEDYFEGRGVAPFEFSATAHENTINGTQFFQYDKHVIDKNTSGATGGNPMRPNRFNSLINPVNIIPPVLTNNVRNIIGDQDDILAGASKAYTVTKTSAHTIAAGTLDSPFQPNKGSYLSLSGVDENNNCTLEIDMSASPVAEIDMIGFIFRLDPNNYIPKYVKVEAVSSSGGAYSQIALITNNTQPFWYASTYVGTCYKLRFTFGSSNTVNASRFIRIYRIFATSISASAGKAWLNAAEGGNLYGALNMNKNKTTNFVLDSGATASRPASPVVGQVFYDTTLGKPIYCKVGGASPTWTDSAGTTV
jgi:hypothetical protein